ncbi:hypothetical protein E2C01_037069 [Portunus trituberculatus]|uniref:Uncharacterized protein n=1 Tax=Portunus trituberculatus TaxID=210409 RepID=A0A5B7F8D0_PORTR|nr:hypothetical protein [Portunus trituberculatus]
MQVRLGEARKSDKEQRPRALRPYSSPALGSFMTQLERRGASRAEGVTAGRAAGRARRHLYRPRRRRGDGDHYPKKRNNERVCPSVHPSPHATPSALFSPAGPHQVLTPRHLFIAPVPSRGTLRTFHVNIVAT